MRTLRGYSYDPKPYINEDAKVYNRVVVPTVKYSVPYNLDVSDSIDKVVDFAVRNGIDMTDSYSDWFAIGCSLASELGESGRVYFHALSRISTKYKHAECDKKYNECLKANRIAVGTFFYLAKLYGINV